MERCEFIIAQLGITDTQRALMDIAHLSGSFHTRQHTQKQHENDPNLQLTPYYFSGKPEDVKPEFRSELATLSAAAILEYLDNDLNYDLVAGVPNSGLAIAEVISRKTGILLITLEKEILSDGRRRISSTIHGSYQPGQKVLGVENIVAYGNSALEFRGVLASQGLHLARLISVYSRHEGGLERLQVAGINASSVLTSSEVVMYLRWAKSPPALDFIRYSEIMDFIVTKFMQQAQD